MMSLNRQTAVFVFTYHALAAYVVKSCPLVPKLQLPLQQLPEVEELTARIAGVIQILDDDEEKVECPDIDEEVLKRPNYFGRERAQSMTEVTSPKGTCYCAKCTAPMSEMDADHYQLSWKELRDNIRASQTFSLLDIETQGKVVRLLYRITPLRMLCPHCNRGRSQITSREDQIEQTANAMRAAQKPEEFIVKIIASHLRLAYLNDPPGKASPIFDPERRSQFEQNTTVIKASEAVARRVLRRGRSVESIRYKPERDDVLKKMLVMFGERNNPNNEELKDPEKRKLMAEKMKTRAPYPSYATKKDRRKSIAVPHIVSLY